jgi:RNA polymerase sigma-70 factor (ECF subfamily)
VYGWQTVEGRPLGESDLIESDLIERARRGDLAAFGDLVRRYQEVAVRVAYVSCGDPTEAEDAAQEAMIKAHAALPSFRSGAPFRPWLLRIVANEARNRRRSAGRRAGLALRMAEDRPSNDAAPSPETAVLATETRAALLGAVGGLGPDDRLVLGCRYFLDLSEAETAAMLGVPRGTVKSRSARALARLRKRLTEVAQ